MKFEWIYKGEKLSFEQYFFKHWVIFTLGLCLVFSSLSFMSQNCFDPGNLLYGLAIFAFLGCFLSFILHNKYSINQVFCFLIFSLLVIFGWVWLKGLYNVKLKAFYLLISGLIILSAIYVVLLFTKKATVENGVIFLFLLGFLLRLCYVLFTSVGERQHDLYGFYVNEIKEGGSYGGHGAYISYLFLNNFRLPNFDPTLVDQFYHPPLHYLICALWWKIQASFGIGEWYIHENMQMLSLFYSSVCMVLTYKIAKEIKLDGVGLLICFAIMAVHPTFIIFAGSINNDILSVMLMLVSLYFAIKWFKNKKLYQIIVCGIFIGLAMLTKLSAYMICFPIAILFLVNFVKDYKALYNEQKAFWKKYCLHFGLFLLVCAPIALFWPIRNAVLFDVPIAYVQRLSDDSWQYIGNYSAFERIFMIAPKEFLSHYSVYDQWLGRGDDLYNEINPLVSLFKTSLFGEFISNHQYPLITGVADVMFFVNLGLGICGFVSTVFVLVMAKFNKENVSLKACFAVLYFSTLIFYYIFCFSYPHHCTMNVRYVSLLIFAGSIFIGSAFNDLQKITNENFKDSKQIINYSVIGVVIAFVLLCSIYVALLAKSVSV